MLMVYLVGAIAGSVGHIAYCTLLVPYLEVQVPFHKDNLRYRECTPIAKQHTAFNVSEFCVAPGRTL